jgi:hypothetical protein
LTGLIKAVDSVARNLSTQDAFSGGLVIQSAYKADEASTRALLFSQLEKLTRSVNATRSFQTESDLQDAVEDIIEIFPSLKIEEILLCFKHIRQGKYELYGNLTTNTLIKCLHHYEIEHTVPMREREHTKAHEYQTAHINWKKVSRALEDSGLIKEPKKTLEEAGGFVHLNREDFEEIARAQKEGYEAQNPS